MHLPELISVFFSYIPSDRQECTYKGLPRVVKTWSVNIYWKIAGS